MPYVSDSQRKFFEGCRHNPKHMGGKCPPEKTLNDFHNAEYHSGETQMQALRTRRAAKTART
jgi:hypothetical protein